MSEPDYYKLIGVARTAPPHEIRSKFRAKVLAEHPDRGGDPRKFQILNQAYNILTDPEKRQRYDATGRAEKSPEQEFVEGFGGGGFRFDARPKEADAKAVVNLQDRIIANRQTHEEGFNEWLRQRDQNAMVMTDKDFMKTHLFNAAELATKISHTGPVQHVLGSPKPDASNGPVQVQAKPRPMKKSIDHDEILVRMLAVPVDDSMVYAELKKAGICLGMTGVGRLEQVGNHVENLRTEDTVLVLPKPAKFASERPIGTARTLLSCSEEDVLKIPQEVLEELTPEQICLTPAIVSAYTVLEKYGSKLKPGDSVLMNAAHMSASGSTLLQLCKLLKLKPLCLLALPGAPTKTIKGEYGSKAAWQDIDARQIAPPTVRVHYERISEWLIAMGAEEVFPDAVALLRWRDRNQRMLPKLALDGLGSSNSAEQLIHCLQPGENDGQIVVYGFGASRSMEVSPPLLAAWGGRIAGFNIARWVHAGSANAKKMMSIMENVTKLVRSNKFVLDTVLYKVGEDSMSDAFAHASDPGDSNQIVLIFPTLQEELRSSAEEQRLEKERLARAQEDEAQKRREDEEREKLKNEWLSLLFTDQSVAALSPDGPLPTVYNREVAARKSLVVFIGDEPTADNIHLRELGMHLGSSGLVNIAWSQHSAGEALVDFNVRAPEILDGSHYLRDRAGFQNEDLDLLHDVELLGRSLTEAVECKLNECALDWNSVVIVGFGKGAGIALYAVLLGLLPKYVCAMVLFSPIVLFPTFLGEKLQAVSSSTVPAQAVMKVFLIWGNRNRSTPANYRQLLLRMIKKTPQVHCTPDILPDGDHALDSNAMSILSSLLPLCMPR
mmetsp:Transcript_115359/g.229980  ORF Transcript_115359/g.229980 Transcript_115359/m.229980 type:complete len:835 (-) Transcript_115359:267-2771(-)